MGDVAQAALLVAFPVAAAAGGAGLAGWRPPGPRLTSAIQHFAAGVVLAALAGEVLPDLRSEGEWAWASAGFALGVALVLALAAHGRQVDASAREHRRRAFPWACSSLSASTCSSTAFWWASVSSSARRRPSCSPWLSRSRSAS